MLEQAHAQAEGMATTVQFALLDAGRSMPTSSVQGWDNCTRKAAGGK